MLPCLNRHGELCHVVLAPNLKTVNIRTDITFLYFILKTKTNKQTNNKKDAAFKSPYWLNPDTQFLLPPPLLS